jgi:glycosyltransferase involved in cell wall biosynthesis
MKKYKVSIFCSVYKGEKFIEGYLEDVFKQTMFEDTEFVILDCNSPENERKYIEPRSRMYENVKYIRLDEDPGLYPAWNIAIKQCQADIIGNWNVDDRKPCHGIELLYKLLVRKPHIDVAYGITYVSRTANEKYEDNSYNLVYPISSFSLENLLNHNSPHCMPLWRKSLHDRFGYFDESYFSAADGEFWLRCAFGGAKLELLNHPVGLYYENPQGRSTNPEHLARCLEEVHRSKQPYLDIFRENTIKGFIKEI